jgi:hypothetical protein
MGKSLLQRYQLIRIIFKHSVRTAQQTRSVCHKEQLVLRTALTALHSEIRAKRLRNAESVNVNLKASS